MKTLKENLLKNIGVGKTKLIEEWLSAHGIRRYHINKDYTISLEDDVSLYYDDYDELPEYIQFASEPYADRQWTFYIFNRCGIIKSFRGLPEAVESIFLNISLKMNTLPPLHIQVDYIFNLTGNGITKFEDLDIKYTRTDLSSGLTLRTRMDRLKNVRVQGVNKIDVRNTHTGEKINRVIAKEPDHDKDHLPISEKTMRSIQSILDGVDLRDVKYIYPSDNRTIEFENGEAYKLNI